MFNEALFREKYNLLTNNIVASLSTAHMIDGLLLEIDPKYAKKEEHIQHQKIFDYYLECGGTVEEIEV